MTWEHEVLILGRNDRQAREQLNNAAGQGWELVSVDCGVAYLKRPKEPPCEST